MNAVKKQIQKEEYIALAVNKYILHTGKLPINSENSFDWSVLKTKEYLGVNFNNKNPITNKTIKITFDENNNIMIKGALEKSSDYDIKNAYLYNFYINRVFRVNTSSAKSTNVQELLKGSQVLYPKLQKQIVRLLKDKKIIKLDNETCPNSKYFYELKNKELIYKYCKDNKAIEVYQDSPIYLENQEDLAYVKAKSIGDKAYVQKSGKWYEYYYQGDVSVSWMPVDGSNSLVSQNPDEDIEDKILSYIPKSKDLVLRNDGGCMLANGDIFCWGNNTHKKAGIHKYGQLNPNLSPDYINTPVMLKVQINDSIRRDKLWYNNPYRVKFEKMAMNSTNVCGISPIFDYYKSGEYFKFGGDLYCNGSLDPKYFEDISSIAEKTSILKRNKDFYIGKADNKQNNQGEKYLIDLAMVDETIAVLSSDGKIYTFGKNNKGSLGQNISDENHISNSIEEVYLTNPSTRFKKLFALRAIRCFGALDEDNRFWIWGERPDGSAIKAPYKLGENVYNKNAIFVNDTDFILKGLNNKFYRTYDISSVKQILTSVPEILAVSINDKPDGTQEYLYIDGKRQLQGSASKLKECRKKDDNRCNTSDSKVFNDSLNELNKLYMSPKNQEYASFSNIAVFNVNKVDTRYRIPFETQVENFENGYGVWKCLHNGYQKAYCDYYTAHANNPRITKFLGKFEQRNVLNSAVRSYDFGRVHKNKKVRIKFDFIRIDDWTSNVDFIQVVANAKPFAKYYSSWRDNSGIKLPNLVQPYGRHNQNDRRITLEYETNLDDNGTLELKIEGKTNNFSHLDSWGIDNVTIEDIDPSSRPIEDKKYVCAMTGLGSKSQMYCWGEVGRSLPLLNTSLYDYTKVDRMNKLFVNDNKDKKKQLFFDEFNKNGNLFLKYPVYIGGFDYEFYFK